MRNVGKSVWNWSGRFSVPCSASIGMMKPLVPGAPEAW